MVPIEFPTSRGPRLVPLSRVPGEPALRADRLDGHLLLVEGVGPGYDPRERFPALRVEATER